MQNYQFLMDKNQQKGKENCQICKKKFGGVFSNEHQCKRCLRSVCKQCCSKKKTIFTRVNTKMQQHRCCDLCLLQSEKIVQYIKINGLAYNNLSKQGRDWSDFADIDVLEIKNSPTKQKMKTENIYLLDVWSQMTPSFRELTGMLISKIAISNIDNSLRNVAQKIVISSTLSFQLVLPLITYILCHSDEFNSIKITNYLIKLADNVSQAKIANNIEILSNAEKLNDQKVLKSLINFSKNSYKSYIYSYFLNCLEVDVVHYILIESLLSGDSSIVELAYSVLIFEFRKQILSEKFDQKTFKNVIYQGMNLKVMEKSIKKLRKIIVKSEQTGSLSKIKSEKQSSAKEQEELKSPKKVQQKQQSMVNMDKVSSKLQEAMEFLSKVETSEMNQNEDATFEDIQQLEKYLDFVIQDNEKGLKECLVFEKMLASIEQQLYLTKKEP